MTEIVELAKAAAQLLEPVLPYLLAIGKAAQEKATEAFGEGLWDGAKRLWGRITGRGAAAEAVVEAAKEVALAPSDPDAAAAFRLQLRKLLAAEPSLVAEVEPIVRQLQQIQAIQVHVTGSGAAAVGPGATAGGAGSTVITGSVGGNVTVGDRKNRGAKAMAEDEARTQLERQVAELEAELQRKRAELEARVTGPGALAFGPGAVAGGQGSLIIPGTVTGNVTKIGTAHFSAAASPTAALRREYLAGLLTEAGNVDLAAIDPLVIDSEGRDCPRLESIYTSLRVRGGLGKFEPRNLARGHELSPVLALVDRKPRLVLLGAPGSGKSTFLRFLAVCLAGELLKHPTAHLTALRQPLPDPKRRKKPKLQPWSAPTLLPVLVTLRDFAATGLPPVGQKATVDHVWRFLESTVPTGFFPALREELCEKGGFLLFDGLDEVPQAEDRRGQILEAIEAFIGVMSSSRVVVTCRTYAYQNPAWRLRHFAVAELALFDDAQIEHFVRLWYADAARRGTGVKPELAGGRAAALIAAIDRNRHIRALAERPLLLTLMASLHAFGGRELPERREELYAETVELLLYRWEKKRRDTTRGAKTWQPSLTEWLETSRAAIRGVLEALAFEAHERQPETVGSADLARGDLVDRLLELRARPTHNPAELFEYLRDRAGLLLPRGSAVFTFPHRSFQEYLAACHLARRQDYPDKLAELARNDPDRWREVTLLAAATASATTPGPLWDLVEALCPKPFSPASTEADAWGAHIAAQALLERELPATLPDRHAEKVERLRTWLVALLTSGHLPARERALAGRNLAALGDPRANVTTLAGMEFCWVPSGPFLMGDDDERPVDLEGYWLARFPVTGAQWREYVEASGAKIGDRRSLETAANEPAVLVSWREAVACCRWLTERWREASLIPAGWEVRLPSEEEWEKAARGGLNVPVAERVARVSSLRRDEAALDLRPNPEKERSYPWAGGADPERANYGDSGIGRPSGVGAFPTGKSPYGCEELSGNAWEWTSSLYQVGDESLRVLRGGSYFLNARVVRCSYRDWYYPLLRLDYVGFRVLLSPFFSEP